MTTEQPSSAPAHPLQNILPASLRFYGVDGEEIGIFTWEEMVDSRYETGFHDRISKDLLVSTIWEGLDYRLLDRGSLDPADDRVKVWETASCVDGSWTPRERYTTELEARLGHALWVARLSGGLTEGEAK